MAAIETNVKSCEDHPDDSAERGEFPEDFTREDTASDLNVKGSVVCFLKGVFGVMEWGIDFHVMAFVLEGESEIDYELLCTAYAQIRMDEGNA